MDPADLYGLSLERFIPERGALAKALRADGRREDAAEVSKLRKPSVAAWAVNQVVRTQGKEVRALYDAGDAVRRAQADLLAGKGDARALRKATVRERETVDRLVDAARGLLTSEGHELSPAIIERVAETLNAAALDEAARKQASEGTLERELRHVGFGLDAGEVALTPPAQPRERPKKPKTEKAPARGEARVRGGKPKKDKKAGREREAERKGAAARRAERKKAREAETAARRRLERAQRALEAAEERLERASAAFNKAEEALSAARAEAEAALAEHDRAKANAEAASTD